MDKIIDVSNVSENDYPDKFIQAIEKAKTQEDKRAIINRVYEDGFSDGYNEKEAELNN